MSQFDLFALDDLESDDVLERLAPWLDGLLAAFQASPEAAALTPADSEQRPGWFGRLFADYAIRAVGVPITKMSPIDAEEVLFDVFPRKVVMESAEEPDEALREVTAFWQWLGREWKLGQAAEVLARFEARGAEFRERMFDELLWGPAKQFVMPGTRAGFDMHDPIERETFMHVYNAALGTAALPAASRPNLARSQKKGKNKKKMAKLSRRRNRKK